jgi:N4-gp56 family major capsid protein
MAAARTIQGSAGAGQLGAVQDIYLEKMFLKFLKRRLVAVPLCKKSTLPENSGRTVRWNFFVAPTRAIANLTNNTTTEGTTPSVGTAYTLTSVTGTLSEFQNYLDYSRVFQLISLAGSIDEVARVMAYEAAMTFDAFVIDGANGTSTTVDAGTAMTAEALRQGVAALENNDAQPNSATPGGAFYAGLFSAEAAYDMMGEGAPVWFQAKSSDYQAALTTPWDDTVASSGLYKCLVKVTNNIISASSEDFNLIVAEEGIACASLGTDPIGPRVIHTRPDDNIASPTRNYGTIGWWGLFAGGLLQNKCVAYVKSDAGTHSNTAATWGTNPM